METKESFSPPRQPDKAPGNDGCVQLERELASLRKRLSRLERIEREHANQTAFMQQLIDLIPMGIAVHTNGVATFINSAGVTMIRAKSAEDILGKPVIDFVHPDHRERALKRIQELQVQDSRELSPVAPYVEEKFIRLDGETIDVEVAAFPMTLAADQNAILVIFRDITEQKRQQQAIQERERRFRQLVSLLPDATIIHKNGVIFFANQTALQMLRIETEDDIVGRTVFEFLHPDEHEKVRKRIKTLLRTGTPVPVVNERIMRSDGDVFLAETVAFPFIERGELAVLVVMHDVTEQKKLLKALEKSESKFRSLAELLPASVFIVSEFGEILYINRSSQAILGYTPEELISIDANEIIPPEALAASGEKMAALDVGENTHFELQVKTKAGSWIWMDVALTKMVLDERIVGLGVATDITWRKETEALLKEQAQKLVKAYEDERARIARELHDEIGQQLIGMKFALERAQHFTLSEEGLNALHDARQMQSNLTETVRELSLSFRPSMLDDMGLLPTLLWHFERYSDQTGIRVNFNHSGIANRRFSQTIEITVYRIVQESLTNVARHAQIDKAIVTVQADERQINVTVVDKGVGFAPESALTARDSSGLHGMQERVHLLGGELIVESVIGRGTVISANLPLLNR